MVSHRVIDVINGVTGLARGRSRPVTVSRVRGSELVRIGGGDMIATPIVPELPTRASDRERGLCGDNLALPAANVYLLADVRLFVGENLIRTTEGSVVVDNASPDRPARARRHSLPDAVVHHEGTAALYGSALGSHFDALVAGIAPIVLLQHAALRRLGPITVMHLPSLSMLERYLLEAASNSQVRLEEVPAGTVVAPDRTAYPAPVTRRGAGAVPRWFRRWVDVRTQATEERTTARKLLLTHGSSDPLVVHPELAEAAREAGFSHVDTLSGQAEDRTLGAEELVATIAHASTVLGAGDPALASALLCRNAEVIQLGTEATISPRVAQLAASKALPYRFVRPDDLGEVLEAL